MTQRTSHSSRHAETTATTTDDVPANDERVWRYRRCLTRGLHHNDCVEDSILFLDAIVHRNTVLSRSVVHSDALLVGCPSIGVTRTLSLIPRDVAATLSISVGPESGGSRHLRVDLECTMIDIAGQLSTITPATVHPPIVASVVEPGGKGSAAQRPSQEVDMNVFSYGSSVCDTGTLDHVFLYPHARIISSICVEHVTMAPSATICHGGIVRNVLMQCSAAIADNSHVSQTLLMEHSVVGPHSIVAQSVLGPDVHVSAGEVHASVIGPNTNAHHQSLLIGVVWILGRGNVGYGANVGSNHTGRIPDQETWCGEGVFWGLSSVIKMPVNLIQAPYSVIAAGVTLPPQRLMMPFSLIVTSQQNAAVNDILPGWVLHSSPYTISRSAKKYSTRRQARNHAFYTGWHILRPDTIDQCRWARHALQQGDQSVLGIGECHLNAKARMTGIRAYSDCIQRYALGQFLSSISQKSDSVRDVFSMLSSIPIRAGSVRLPTLSTDTPPVAFERMPWNEYNVNVDGHAMAILLEEFGPFPVPVDNSKAIQLQWFQQRLTEVLELERDYATRVYTCKQRDDVRGQTIIPGYAQAHVGADNDSVVHEVRLELEEVERQVQCLLLSINSSLLTSRL